MIFQKEQTRCKIVAAEKKKRTKNQGEIRTGFEIKIAFKNNTSYSPAFFIQALFHHHTVIFLDYIL